jgi:hypothetical protein
MMLTNTILEFPPNESQKVLEILKSRSGMNEAIAGEVTSTEITFLEVDKKDRFSYLSLSSMVSRFAQSFSLCHVRLCQLANTSHFRSNGDREDGI